MTKRLALLALMMLSCASTHPSHRVVADAASHEPVEVDAVDVVTPAPLVSPVEPEAPIAARGIPANLAAPQQPHTAVQLAPSFYPEEFRSNFSRTRPEIENLQDPALYDVTVLVLSRLLVSEANWIHDNDFDRQEHDQNRAGVDGPPIYKVLRNTRRNGETLVGVMRRTSHFVTEQWTTTNSRTRWVVELNLEGTRPEHFPAHLNWERDYLPRWQAVQELAKDLLRGHKLGVCASAPIIAWGGRCDDGGGACDDHIAEARGLVPYEHCGDTSNRFWCRPGVAGCVREAQPPSPDPAAVVTG